MKKIMLLLALCAMFVGCEDKNGVSYSDYPVAGKSFKHLDEDGDGDYTIYRFSKNGRLYKDYYYDDKREFGVVNYWWMEGDSVFAESGKERKDKIFRGCYYGDFISRYGYKNHLYLITQ